MKKAQFPEMGKFLGYFNYFKGYISYKKLILLNFKEGEKGKSKLRTYKFNQLLIIKFSELPEELWKNSLS